MRRKHINFNYLVGYGSIGLLGLLLLALFLPHASSSSTASSCLDDPTMEGCYTTMAETEVGVTASTAISLAMNPQVNMEVIPKSNGATSSASTKLSVSTNSPDGYALYMQTGSVSGDLVSTVSYSESKIANTTKSNVTLSNLEQNSYGYALTEGVTDANTTYSTVPTTGSVIKKTTSVTPSDGNYAYGDTYNLAFGVNVGTNLEAGTYTGSVMISAVANPKTIATMFDLTYMQDMTSDICVNTREGYTKQLIDTRDGKSYWVAKLKDGNCWMTQNLALDITEDGLKASDTDIEEDWNQDSTYPPSRTNSLPLLGEGLAMSNTDTYSWSFGRQVIGLPLYEKYCTREGVTSHPEWFSVYTGESMGVICESVGFLDVSDDEWKSTFVAQEGEWKFQDGTTYSGIITGDKNDKTYDAHYLVGNYYSWSAATAGTGGGVEVGNASGSVCPKGWSLPNGTLSSAEERSISNLARFYGISDLIVSSDQKYNLVLKPLYFISGGSVLYSGSISTLGTSGTYQTAYGMIDSDRLTSVQYNFAVLPREKQINYARYDNYRTGGVSVRCVAR